MNGVNMTAGRFELTLPSFSTAHVTSVRQSQGELLGLRKTLLAQVQCCTSVTALPLVAFE